MLLTRLPLPPKRAFDLHVLSLPPAFVLSQDQTLRFDLRFVPAVFSSPRTSIAQGTQCGDLGHAFPVIKTEKNCDGLGRPSRIDENIILNTPEMTEAISVFVTFSKNVSAEVSYRMVSDKGKSDPLSSYSAAHVSLSSYSIVKEPKHSTHFVEPAIICQSKPLTSSR